MDPSRQLALAPNLLALHVLCSQTVLLRRRTDRWACDPPQHGCAPTGSVLIPLHAALMHAPPHQVPKRPHQVCLDMLLFVLRFLTSLQECSYKWRTGSGHYASSHALSAALMVAIRKHAQLGNDARDPHQLWPYILTSCPRGSSCARSAPSGTGPPAPNWPPCSPPAPRGAARTTQTRRPAAAPHQRSHSRRAPPAGTPHPRAVPGGGRIPGTGRLTRCSTRRARRPRASRRGEPERSRRG